MSDRHVEALLKLNDSFTGPLRRAKAAAEAMNRQWALDNATWEPHDWGDL